MPATPAAIPVEDALAHHSEYDPTLALTSIAPHPKNIRHDAAADPELVQSIRTQGLLEPLLVAPHPDAASGFDWVLIAGHRRKNGCEAAGHTSAPAIIRHDLVDEADQIAAMLVENGRRQDLTPIEEAEGFDVLIDFGWDVERIANTYGCSSSTVKARRKLTSLKPSFQEQVTAGQVTLDDAIALASLPEKEQKRLEKVAPSQIRYELARSQHRVTAQAEIDKQIKAYTALGGTEQDFPKGGFFHGLTDEKDGMTPFHSLPFFLREADRHPGCLGWCDTGTSQYPGISLVCTNVSGHDDEIAAHQAEVLATRSDEEKARQAEIDARAAEQTAQREQRAAADESRRVAARLRGDVVLEATRKVKTPAVLAPVLRAALMDFFVDWPLDEQLFQDLADVPDDLRWTSWNGTKPYLDSIPTMTPTQLWRAFTAALVAHIEQSASYAIEHIEEQREASILGDYITELVDAGHQLTPPDEELNESLDAFNEVNEA